MTAKNEKFGYHLSTFQKSFLKSVSAGGGQIDNKEKIDIVSRRFLSCNVEELEEDLVDGLFYLQSQFCHSRSPSCDECPARQLCNINRTKKVINKNNQKIKFGDLFSGAGGLSLGLSQVNAQAMFAVDKDLASCLTFLCNHKELIEDDVFNDEVESIKGIKQLKQIDILVGGPPCQGFSNANRQRLSEDPRNELYKHFLEVLGISSAQYAIVENVPGMLKAIDSIREEFSEIGYAISMQILNAKDFGLPQNRPRAFIFAKRKEGQKLDQLFFKQVYENICAQKKTYSVPLSEAINGLPELQAKDISNATELENSTYGFSCSLRQVTEENSYLRFVNNGYFSPLIFNHRTKYLNMRDQKIYSLLEEGEDSTSPKIRHLNPYLNRQDIFKDKFYKLKQDAICKTITAHMYYDCHMYIHPTQARGLTPREAARIQGFPDDYIFMGYPNEWYRQIGNAVSPVVGRVIGKAFKEVLNA